MEIYYDYRVRVEPPVGLDNKGDHLELVLVLDLLRASAEKKMLHGPADL